MMEGEGDVMGDVLDRIREAGIIGAGGAGFPTHVKFSRPCEYIVLNGAECEPLLQVDQQLAAVHAEALLHGMEALLELTGAKKAVFAFKGKYHDARARIEPLLSGNPRMALHVLPNIYPAGDEQVLVYEALRRIVPEGGIPMAVETVVLNVETLLNVEKALSGTPVTEKYLTVCGAVREPRTLRVPIGVPFSAVVEACGGVTEPDAAFIEGGPMMGKPVPSWEKPVTKTTKGLLVLPRNHRLVVSKERSMKEMLRLARAACCHCMMCTELCPRYLLGHSLHPDKLMRLASFNSTCERDAEATEAFLCCECGMCEVACVMGLQPWRLNRELKGRMASAGIKNPHANRPAAAHPFRELRTFSAARLLHRLGLAPYAKRAPLDESLSFKSQSVIRPQSVTLMLKQHIGAPSVPLVAVGDRVEREQLVARGEGPVSANLHSPISGTVAGLEKDRILIRAEGAKVEERGSMT